MSSKDNKVEIFVHAEGRMPVPVKVLLNESLEDILKLAGIEPKAELNVFCGESVEALSQSAQAEGLEEDKHEPVSMKQTLDKVEIGKPGHIHCHRCKKIKVTVNYKEKTVIRQFSPATRIQTITVWARKQFGLTDIDADKMILEIDSTNERPRQSQHVGELVNYPDCKIVFSLVPEHKEAGM
jgi:hypothetical protein